MCHTHGMKTAISISDDIFRKIEQYAREHNYSRSEVFAAAVEEFLRRRESQKLLDALNKVYSVIESPEEKTIRKKGKKYYSRKVLKERY